MVKKTTTPAEIETRNRILRTRTVRHNGYRNIPRIRRNGNADAERHIQQLKRLLRIMDTAKKSIQEELHTQEQLKAGRRKNKKTAK